MKTKLFLFPVILFLGCLSAHKSFSQLLKITEMGGFPICPLDSVHEGDTVNFTLQIVNLDTNSSAFNDTLNIFFRNDTAVTIQTEIVTSFVLDSLSGNDTLNFTQIFYTFTGSRYKAGNNIIVVWPRIGSDSTTTADSLETCVYFIPLLAINILSVQNEAFSIFPNPVTDEIKIKPDHQNSIEYVRILNDIGQEILFRRSIGNYLNVRFLAEGFYFIEIKERNGLISRRKFLKL